MRQQGEIADVREPEAWRLVDHIKAQAGSAGMLGCREAGGEV